MAEQAKLDPKVPIMDGDHQEEPLGRNTGWIWGRQRSGLWVEHRSWCFGRTFLLALGMFAVLKDTSNFVTASPVRPSAFDRRRQIENDDYFF